METYVAKPPKVSFPPCGGSLCLTGTCSCIFNTPSAQGFESKEVVSKLKRFRITLTSQNVKNVEKACSELVSAAVERGLLSKKRLKEEIKKRISEKHPCNKDYFPKVRNEIERTEWCRMYIGLGRIHACPPRLLNGLC